MRPILSDMLPAEVPIGFDTYNFYKRVQRLDLTVSSSSQKAPSIEVSSKILKRTGNGYALSLSDDTFVQILLNERRTQRLKFVAKDERATRKRYSADYHIKFLVPIKRITVSSVGKTRLLSIMHPLSMLQTAQFMVDYSETILLMCNRSLFSLRRPIRVTSMKNFDDRLYRDRKVLARRGVEEEGLEYKNFISYFAYSRYGFIGAFYDSAEFRFCEQKYNVLLKMDIADCFNRIYTHVFAWVFNGKLESKKKLGGSSSHQDFGNKLDKLLQSMNFNETNGILIGPEFSRICAEILFQEIDVRVEKALLDKGFHWRKDYEILRYVDDYFIFCRHENSIDNIQDVLERELSEFNLSLNTAKTEVHSLPFASKESISKKTMVKSIRDSTHVDIPVIGESGPEEAARVYFDRDGALREISRELLISGTPVSAFASLYIYRLIVNLDRKLEKAKSFANKLRDAMPDEPNGARRPNDRVLRAFLVDWIRFCSSQIDVAARIYKSAPNESTSLKIVELVVASLEFLNGIQVGYLDLTSFKSRVRDVLFDLIRLEPAEDRIETRTLNLIDSLTFLEMPLSEDERNELFATSQVSSFSVFEILVLLRSFDPALRNEFNDDPSLREALVSRSTQLAQSDDMSDVTTRAFLVPSLADCPYLTLKERKDITGLSKSRLKTIEKDPNFGYFEWKPTAGYRNQLVNKAKQHVYW